jgi:hypothetical protein
MCRSDVPAVFAVNGCPQLALPARSAYARFLVLTTRPRSTGKVSKGSIPAVQQSTAACHWSPHRFIMLSALAGDEPAIAIPGTIKATAIDPRMFDPSRDVENTV